MGYPYGGGEMRSAEQRVAEERARMAELRAAEERAKFAEMSAAEERINTRLAEIRTAEERVRKAESAPSGMSPEMLAMFFAAMRGVNAGAPAYTQPQPMIQQPAQQPQPILITNQPAQAPTQQQDGHHVVPPGAVMTTTSTTTIDASKRQNPATGYSGYEDDYDYNVYERLDDKNN